ncbi:MAG: thiamine pyrophosphate-dependent enzyme [Thermodesulfovibrionales bacterium]|nr:thiamine pyrophosphate-dependent enzyme [Thermodesulfovibrionales bacterium]
MKEVFSRPKSLKNKPFHYCPGCGHSIVHRLIAECVDNLKIKNDVIGIAPVGCAVFAYDYFDFDMIEVAHGRPPAVATAIKRVLPEKVVFSYQGDGDLAAIGTSEIIHASARGENISVFFINNATYGMTGGQMAPTTLLGQKTKTTILGRKKEDSGSPLKMAEIISQIDGSSFVARTSVDSVKNIRTTSRLIEKAFNYQIQNKGFCFVEILSPCPTDWYLSPVDSLKWIQTVMTKTFQLGVIKDIWKGQ